MSLKSICLKEEDYRHNAEKFLLVLSDIGLTTHITIDDILMCSQREMILFVIQLYHTMPHYVPKGLPIVFSCILGEEIVKNIGKNINE